MTTSRLRVLSVIGTRPEAIKLAPVILALEEQAEAIESRVCFTSQHRSLVEDVLTAFAIKPHRDLAVMTPGQTPSRVAARVLEGMEEVLAEEHPDVVIVQGETDIAKQIGDLVASSHASSP